MARNVKFQILRGTQANLPSDLALGEMYFASDSNLLFFGTPGIGKGYIQIADEADVKEKLDQLILIMESMRRAMVALACQGGTALPQDFDVDTIAREINSTDGIFS